MPDLINWEDIALRYPQIQRGSDSSQVNTYWINYAERQLEGMLHGFYTTPFSTNNITAKDLAIDLAFSRMNIFKAKDSAALKESVIARIKALKNGDEVMMLDDGNAVLPSVGETIWNSGGDYFPVFGMDDEKVFRVDSSQLFDEELARD